MTTRRLAVVVCVLAVGVGLAAAAGAGGLNRSAPDTVGVGENATVTVTVATGSGGPFSLSETFDGPVAGAAVRNVTVDGSPANPILDVADQNGSVVTLTNTPPNATVAVTYVIQAGNTTGQVNITSDRGGPATTIDVVTRPPITGLSRRVPAGVNVTETATVTVSATTNASGGPFALAERFGGGVANATVRNVTVTGTPVSPAVVRANASGASVELGQTAPGGTVEVTYAVEPATTAGQITIDGSVSSGGATFGLGTDSITVRACGLSPVAIQYETSGDCAVDVAELGRAASDYAAGTLTIGDLGRVAAAYASS